MYSGEQYHLKKLFLKNYNLLCQDILVSWGNGKKVL
jgi:hypothetical protein